MGRAQLTEADEAPILGAHEKTTSCPPAYGLVRRARSMIWKVLHRHGRSRRPRGERGARRDGGRGRDHRSHGRQGQAPRSPDGCPTPTRPTRYPTTRTWESPVATIRFSTNRDVVASATERSSVA